MIKTMDSFQIPDFKIGDTLKVHQKIREKDKEKIQIFEGILIARHRKKEKGTTITLRKIASGGIGVEKIFPLYSPIIKKIEIVKKGKTRRAKLYYLRKKK